ncbi:MAG: LysE family transporter [Acidilobaceae archaeon]
MLRALLSIVLLTLAITPTGAFAPGPLSATALASGASLGAIGGLIIALGHALFELPYVIALYKALGKVERSVKKFKPFMTFIAAFFMLYFAYLLFSSAYDVYSKGSIETNSDIRSFGYLDALVAGLALTGFNAHFLLWWITVGFPLIAEARRLGYVGLTVMYSVHVSMDFFWLALLAVAGAMAKSLDYRLYATLLVALAIFLVFFVLRTIFSEMRVLREGEKRG